MYCVCSHWGYEKFHHFNHCCYCQPLDTYFGLFHFSCPSISALHSLWGIFIAYYFQICVHSQVFITFLPPQHLFLDLMIVYALYLIRVDPSFIRVHPVPRSTAHFVAVTNRYFVSPGFPAFSLTLSANIITSLFVARIFRSFSFVHIFLSTNNSVSVRFKGYQAYQQVAWCGLGLVTHHFHTVSTPFDSILSAVAPFQISWPRWYQHFESFSISLSQIGNHLLHIFAILLLSTCSLQMLCVALWPYLLLSYSGIQLVQLWSP